MQTKCYDCLDSLGSNYHIVDYPVKDVAEGEMVKDNPTTTTVYLCDDCFEENQEKVVKEYE